MGIIDKAKSVIRDAKDLGKLVQLEENYKKLKDEYQIIESEMISADRELEESRHKYLMLDDKNTPEARKLLDKKNKDYVNLNYRFEQAKSKNNKLQEAKDKLVNFKKQKIKEARASASEREHAELDYYESRMDVDYNYDAFLRNSDLYSAQYSIMSADKEKMIDLIHEMEEIKKGAQQTSDEIELRRYELRYKSKEEEYRKLDIKIKGEEGALAIYKTNIQTASTAHKKALDNFDKSFKQVVDYKKEDKFSGKSVSETGKPKILNMFAKGEDIVGYKTSIAGKVEQVKKKIADLITGFKQKLTQNQSVEKLEEKSSNPEIKNQFKPAEESQVEVVNKEPVQVETFKEEPSVDDFDKEQVTDAIIKEEPVSDAILKQEPVQDATVKEEPSTQQIEEPKKKKGFFARLFGGRDKKKEDKKVDAPAVEEKVVAEAKVEKVDPAEIAAETPVTEEKVNAPVAEEKVVEVVVAEPVALSKEETKVESVEKVENAELVGDIISKADDDLENKVDIIQSELPVNDIKDQKPAQAPSNKTTNISIDLKNLAIGALTTTGKLKITNEQETAIRTIAKREVIAKLGENAFTGKKKNIAQIMLGKMVKQQKNKLLGMMANMRNAAKNQAAPVEEKVVAEPAVKEKVVEAVVAEPVVAAPVVEEKIVEEVVAEQVETEVMPVEKAEIKKEYTLSEYMQAYAANYKNYYSKDKWVNSNKKALHDEETRKKQRKINAQMKSLIGKQLKNEIGVRGQDAAFMNKLNAINEMDLEDLAKNDAAVMKLFQIASNGVYEDGGKRIRLTTTQRLKLSDVLVSVSEKRIENENKLAQQNAKANENAQQEILNNEGLENGK